MSAIASPCIRLCQMEAASGLCRGCHRSLDEIAGWGRMSPAERQAIMALLPARAEAARSGSPGGGAAG